MIDFAPSPLRTDGEAENPGPRNRRSGPRSHEARERRAIDNNMRSTKAIIKQAQAVLARYELSLAETERICEVHTQPITCFSAMNKSLPPSPCEGGGGVARVGTVCDQVGKRGIDHDVENMNRMVFSHCFSSNNQNGANELYEQPNRQNVANE